MGTWSFKINNFRIFEAMGMLHEQSRPDRDNFLIINWNNIQPNYHSQVKDQNHKNKFLLPPILGHN